MVDYSKWDKLVISDDEDERQAPFYDSDTLFRMREEMLSPHERKQDRLKRMAALDAKKAELLARKPKNDDEREEIFNELKIIDATERKLSKL